MSPVQRESEVEALLSKEVRSRLGVSVKMVPVVPGLPDRLVLLPGGRIFFVELKSLAGRTSSAQLWWHRRLRGLGFRVDVVTGTPGVRAWLAERDEEA